MPSIDNVLTVLWEIDSAPGAHIWVQSFTNTPATDKEIDEWYESAEGWNDSATSEIVKTLSPEQFAQLVAALKELNQEYKESYGPEYSERMGGLDIDALLQ